MDARSDAQLFDSHGPAGPIDKIELLRSTRSGAELLSLTKFQRNAWSTERLNIHKVKCRVLDNVYIDRATDK